ncbi:MAG: hydrogenase nickel incorporation protein HypB [Sedimentisphaerales bacterium]|nr:hydrogenase nickel incorporation protein HypB [Sedimentisphaerales bacterium]
MKIRVVENVLKANDALAQENRQRLDEAAVRTINLMSAPGSGKTTLLEKTIEQLGAERCAVLVGDLQTTRDAERLEKAGAQTIQINTGKGCHLSATEVARGLEELDLDKVEYLFIENVGNMVCPAGFDLGEHQRVALLSIPEGDDKVAKYWTLFQSVDAILLTKMDLLEVLDYDINRVKADLARINTAAPFMEVSSKTGKGMEQWFNWLKNKQD